MAGCANLTCHGCRYRGQAPSGDRHEPAPEHRTPDIVDRWNIHLGRAAPAQLHCRNLSDHRRPARPVRCRQPPFELETALASGLEAGQHVKGIAGLARQDVSPSPGKERCMTQNSALSLTAAIVIAVGFLVGWCAGGLELAPASLQSVGTTGTSGLLSVPARNSSNAVHAYPVRSGPTLRDRL